MLHYLLYIELLFYFNYLIFGIYFLSTPVNLVICYILIIIDELCVLIMAWFYLYYYVVDLLIHYPFFVSYLLSLFQLIIHLLFSPFLYSHLSLLSYNFFSPLLHSLSFHFLPSFVTNYFLDLYLLVSVNLHPLFSASHVVSLLLYLHLMLLTSRIVSLLLSLQFMLLPYLLCYFFHG